MAARPPEGLHVLLAQPVHAPTRSILGTTGFKMYPSCFNDPSTSDIFFPSVSKEDLRIFHFNIQFDSHLVYPGGYRAF